MKPIMIIVTAAAILSGCKSTEEFMRLPPENVFYSKVSPKDLAFCIASEVRAPQQDLGSGSYLVRGETIYGGSSEAFTIRPGENGSIVEYRKAHGLPAIGRTWKKCLDPAGSVVGNP